MKALPLLLLLINFNLFAQNNFTYNFWDNPQIVANYATGGNVTQQRRFFQAADWLRQNPIQSGEYLADIGAGTGEITSLFAMCNSSGRNLAVDYSAAMVNVAQEKVRLAKLSNIQIWTADAMDLNLPTAPETVTRMVSFSAIHWFPQPNKFIEGVNTYLAPGGVFYFRYAGCKDDETLEVAEILSKEEEWKDLFADFTCPMYAHSPELMRKVIEGNGLVCEKLSFWRNTEEFASEKDYSKYVSGWLPHLYHLQDEGLREAFLKAVVHKHCSRKDRRDDRGRIIVKDTQVEIWGSKPKVIL